MSGELIQQPETAVPTALSDLRERAMLAPVDVIRSGIAEYVERRNAFRDGLKAQLKEGLHYGYPPGCEPMIREKDGFVGVRSKGEVRWYPPKQWQAKPSLYKAGADFVCDFLSLVTVFDADEVAWKQLGSVAGTFVFRCRLYPKGQPQTPETLRGEGRGVRRNGQKGGDENNALKMAQKAAKVDAVLNGLGLSDLFTQDLEDTPAGPEQHDNPRQSPIVLVVPPRGERITGAMLGNLSDAWKQWRASRREEATGKQFDAWASEVTGIDVTKIRIGSAWDGKTYGMAVQRLNDDRGVP